MAGKADFTLTMGLVGASTVVTGLQSLIAITGQVIAKVREAAEAVDEYGDVVSGHAVSVSEAQSATNALIDTITMHRQAARLEAAGIQVTSNQFRALSVAALEYANRTGTDATEAMERLTTATVGANARGLRPFGLALREGGTQAQRQQRVLEQLTRAYGDQTYEVEGTADSIQSLQNTWDRAWLEMASAIERSAGPIGTVLRRITGWLDDVANALEADRQAAEHLARMGTETRQREIEQQLMGMGVDIRSSSQDDIVFAGGDRVASPWQMVTGTATIAVRHILEGELGAAITDVTEAGTRITAEARDLIAEYDRLARGDVRDLASGEQPVVRAAERTQIEQEEQGGGGRGGGGPAAARDRLIEQIADKERAVYSALRESEERIAELYADQGEQLEAFWEDLNERQAQAAVDAVQARIDAEEKANEHLLEAQERYMERVLEGVRREEEARSAAIERTQEYATTVSGIFNTMTGAVGGLAESLASTTEEQEQIRGAFYIAEQVGALLLATTMAAINYASQNYTQAAMYTAAAVAAGIGIAKTAIEFGVSSKSGTTGSSASGARAGAGTSTRGTQATSQQTVYVQVYGPVTSRRVYEEITAMEREAARSY